KPSEPNDILDRGPWWEIYNDEVLNGLQAQLSISNESLKAAAQSVEESRALLGQARAAFWPSVGVTAGRQRTVTGTRDPVTTTSLGVTGS
ncbi:TolC family protein, partial [Acinetobacter baumannii]